MKGVGLPGGGSGGQDGSLGLPGNILPSQREILRENGANTKECGAEGWREKHWVGGGGGLRERERENG